jgi:hypothetical protein
MSINITKRLKGAALALMLLSAGVAKADLLNFSLTGSYTAQWQLNSKVSPDDSGDGIGFALYDVEGKFPGSVFSVADLYFYNADQLGGLEIYDYYADHDLLLTDGPQLYTGLESSPTFKVGTFALTDSEGSGTYTLTVTDLDTPPAPPTTSVPEPATAAMLFGGLGLMYAQRKRRAGRQSSQS